MGNGRAKRQSELRPARELPQVRRELHFVRELTTMSSLWCRDARGEVRLSASEVDFVSEVIR